MPNIVTELPQTYENITRPVALDVIRHLVKMTNLPSEVRILYPGYSEETPMAGSLLEDEQPENFFAHEGRVRVVVTEDFTEDRSWTQPVLQKNTLPIFWDPALKVRLAPVYASCELTIEFTYRAPTLTAAQKFRDEFRVKSAMLREDHLIEATYHYSLPPYFVELLKEIYKLREGIMPYHQTLFKWLEDNFSDRATTLTTLVGTEPTLSIPETQQCVIGFFDFNEVPQRAEKGSEGGAFNINFMYKARYDKVIALTASYPLVVHNQLIGEQFRYRPDVHGTQVNPARRKHRPTTTRHALDHFVSVFPPPCYRGLDGIAIPEFDDWEPEQVKPDTSTLVSMMLVVDFTDPTFVMDLDELGDWKIDAQIRDFMRSEGNRMSQYQNSVIYISLYEDELPLGDNKLIIGTDLKVYARQPMDYRKRYHLRIALLNDLNALSPEGLRHLSESGEAGLKILMTLQHRLFGTARLPALVGNNIIPRPFIRDLGVAINDLKVAHSGGLEYRMLTVGNFIVNAKRLDDYAPNANRTDNADSDPNRDSASPVGPDQTDGHIYPVPGCPG